MPWKRILSPVQLRSDQSVITTSLTQLMFQISRPSTFKTLVPYIGRPFQERSRVHGAKPPQRTACTHPGRLLHHHPHVNFVSDYVPHHLLQRSLFFCSSIGRLPRLGDGDFLKAIAASEELHEERVLQRGMLYRQPRYGSALRAREALEKPAGYVFAVAEDVEEVSAELFECGLAAELAAGCAQCGEEGCWFGGAVVELP